MRDDIVPLDDRAERIHEAHERHIGGMRLAVEGAIEAGQALLEAEARLPHDQWLPWLKANCTIPVWMARSSMRVARAHLEGHATFASHSTIESAFQSLFGAQLEPEEEADREGT